MSTTATATMAPSKSTIATSYIIPGRISSDMQDLSGGYGRVVRFDNECILIPDANNRSKRMMLTKSYSLPLWKRKTSNSHSVNSAESDVEEGPSTVQHSLSTQEERVVIKVPIPTFRTKSARSPSRGRSTSSSPPSVPLSPCLVHRVPSTSPTNPRVSPIRRTSLPSSIYQNSKHDPAALTVPLRACCPDCERITEESLKEGDEWKEHFSKGARRRRSSSASSDGMGMGAPYATVIPASSFGVNRPGSPSIPASISPTKPSTFALTVDEVDKRRKSLELARDQDSYVEPESIRLNTHSPASPTPFHHPNNRYPHPYTYRHTNRSASPTSHDRDLSSSSTASTSDDSPDLLLAINTRRMRSSPIEEEDEAQLFPLPSPRRSPNNSPTPSASPRVSPGVSPAPSPNTSSSCLAVPGTRKPPSATSSRESVGKGSSGSEEGVLKGNITRKLVSRIGANGLLDPLNPIPDVDLVAPTPTPSGVSVPFPLDDQERYSSPPSPKGPRTPASLSLMLPSNSTSKRVHATSSLMTSGSEKQLPVLPPTEEGHPHGHLSLHDSGLANHQHQHQHDHHHHHHHASELVHTRSTSLTSPVSNESPSSSPTTSTAPAVSKHRKHSFTFPSSLVKAGGALRDVGVDVLKGVSSISGGVVG